MSERPSRLASRKSSAPSSVSRARPRRSSCALTTFSMPRRNHAVDLRQVEDIVDDATAPKRLDHVEDARLVGNGQVLVELVLDDGVLAVRAQSRAAVLERSKRLAHGLFEGAADGHGLADALHARGQRLVGAAELLERPARHLDHGVVDARLEARRRLARDVVVDLVERVADRELGRDLGDGKAGRLGGQRARAADARDSSR